MREGARGGRVDAGRDGSEEMNSRERAAIGRAELKKGVDIYYHSPQNRPYSK